MREVSFWRNAGQDCSKQSHLCFKRQRRKKLLNQTLQPHERELLLKINNIEEQFAKLETSFREILLKSRVFNEDSLPSRLLAEFKAEVGRTP